MTPVGILVGAAPTAVGDGLLNLYYTAPGAKGGERESTTAALVRVLRRSLQSVSVKGRRGVGVLAAVVLLILARRARAAHQRRPEASLRKPVISGVSNHEWHRYFRGGRFGDAPRSPPLASASEWLGLPSRFAAIALSSDPYRLDVGYDAAAIVLV